MRLGSPEHRRAADEGRAADPASEEGSNGRRFAGLDKSEDREEYAFVQMADPQFGMLSSVAKLQWLIPMQSVIYAATCGFVKGKSVLPIPVVMKPKQLGARRKPDWDEVEIDLSRRAVKLINQMSPRPKFVVVCGDLVHAFPSEGAKQAAQVETFKKIYSEIHRDIPLVCLCGNHDVGDRPTPTSIKVFSSRFGDDYFSFWVGQDKFIVLNSQLYKDASKAAQLADEQDRWLDHELFDKQDDRHRVIFTHIPPFINEPDEPSSYFPLEKTKRLDLLDRAAQAGVTHWFAGHYHRNAQGTFEKGGRRVEVVTTGAVGANITTDPKGDELGLTGMDSMLGDPSVSGLRVVKVRASGISHEFRSIADLEVETQKSGKIELR
ncbi:Serine/threonine-protein phosphatase CPPED1 (Calcineurin-like phosphoesterase domain-containing protein 1) [Durusdinium trenchii]|uniref:Serine/threonine-protein phosphatase CPPED1 (Calcineurin-like phosphoesterase domain-containing protein 1) n=1 Tax=Durusdinium trenchii TaxID=1381693 RepID=A0ABP0RFD1_9DINO